jgi:CubicO group peptidase (beta-lactamase class C family)
LDGQKPANNPPVRSAFEPGLRHQYSGGGTMISQKIIEDITGEPYDAFMWKYVLKPMGMLSSSFTQPPAKTNVNLLATGYYNDGKPVEGKYHIYPEQAAAGLWTNPTDLARYVIETQLALKGKSDKVLSQTMTRLRLTPFIDSTAALGAFINKKGEETYFQHGGVDLGFVSQYYGSLEGGNGVVVMTNTYNAAIVPEIINSVSIVYGWKGFYQPQIKKVIKLNDELLDNYIGKYKAGKNEFSIEKNGSEIFINTNGTKRQLYFTSETDFFTKEAANAEYSFTKDAQNKIDGIELKGNSQKANKIL